MKWINRLLWSTNLLSVLIAAPLLFYGYYFFVGLPDETIGKFYISASVIALLLVIAYDIFHRVRLKRVVRKGVIRSVYWTPQYLGLHKFLDYVLFSPVLFLLVQTKIKLLPINLFFKAVVLNVIIGLVVGLITYFIAFSILVPVFSGYKESFKGIPLKHKLFVPLIVLVLFSFLVGIFFKENPGSALWLLLSIAFIYFYSSFVLKPIHQINSAFSRFLSENPDLNRKLIIRTGDEIETIAENFNQFLDVVKGISSKVYEISQKVSDFAETISSTTEELTASVQEISASIESINTEINNSSNEMEKIKVDAELITSMAESIESQVKMLQKIAQDSENIANESARKTLEVLSTVEENMRSVEVLNNKMEMLMKASEEIMGFADMVSEVAEDTDLLALNASVEAARVGEHGKGFGVIAEEIRNLSNQSRNYLKQVLESLDRVKSAVDEFKNVTQTSWGKLSGAIEHLDTINKSLQKISEDVTLTTTMTNQVSDTIREEVKNISVLFEGIDKINKSFTSTASAMKEIGASTEEQMAAMQEFRSLTEEMLNTAKLLKEMIERYLV